MELPAEATVLTGSPTERGRKKVEEWTIAVTVGCSLILAAGGGYVFYAVPGRGCGGGNKAAALARTDPSEPRCRSTLCKAEKNILGKVLDGICEDSGR